MAASQDPGEGRLGNVCGALLLGGASRRMGSDKTRLVLGGETLAGRNAGLLARLCRDVVLVGGDPAAALPGRAVPDRQVGEPCALRGLVTALEAATAERVLVLATDLPCVSADLLLALTAWPDTAAVAPRDAQGAHPLCAIYQRDAVLPIARRRLEAGELALRPMLGALDAAYLEGADLRALDPDGRALMNVNTPEEWSRLLSEREERG